MFGSNQSLPDTLSLQLLTCLYLPPSCHKPPSPPSTAFFPQQSLIPLTASSCDDVFIYPLKRLHTPAFFLFFLIALTAFACHAQPHLPSDTPRSDPPAQDQSWERPALNIVVCYKQHGVMWTRPGEAQSGVYALNSCQMSLLSAQRFSAFNLQILQYTVHFLFVAADERGPGGMKQITGVEDWEKGAVGWPSTSMYKRRKSKLIV